MFHHRSTDFDTRIGSITGHLRAIEKELGGIGRIAGRGVSAGAAATGGHIADAIGPILSEIVDRLVVVSERRLTKRRVSTTRQSTSVPGLAMTL